MEAQKLTKADFETDQAVRWCPGCGDYSVLANVQRFLPTQAIPREKYVFVSGIGCSSRFPYYMDTYGFHTIHGRAPAVATGIKVTNPDLSVWLITGDGDALSIGGNHFIHLLRRNLDINVLLFNNQIYGLTKGQYSPTSEIGKVTKSTPVGSADYPLNPLLLALGAQATFIARTLDIDAKLMTSIFAEAVAHKGTSLIEIYQNCNIFNDGAFKYVSERTARKERQVIVEHDKPLIFGEEKNKGLYFNGYEFEIVSGDSDKPGATIFDRNNAQMATALARLNHGEFPVPMGVIYQENRQVFDDQLNMQLKEARDKRPVLDSADANLTELFSSGEIWDVT